MIVVDVGCHPHGNEESVYRLVNRFRPDLLLGFDPHPDVDETPESVSSTLVIRRRAAAWIRLGSMPYRQDGIRSRLTTAGLAGGEQLGRADTFDLGAFLAGLPVPLVLKLDCEGSEYPILSDLHARRLDARLDLVLVEWHDKPKEQGFRSEWVEPRPDLRCRVEEW